MDVRTLLAHNMKHYRKVLGISQGVLAARVGCSTVMIGNIEIKKAFPSPDNLDRIAGALEVTATELFADDAGEVVPLSVVRDELKKEIKGRLEVKILEALNEALG
jgi:transcriptional regulator with XRE-family HTH domain